MINWTLLSPKNIAIIATLGLIAYFAFQSFFKKVGE